MFEYGKEDVFIYQLVILIELLGLWKTNNEFWSKREWQIEGLLVTHEREVKFE